MTNPLILLHGAIGSKTQYEKLDLALSEFEVHTLDFEGHGEREGGERPFRMQHFVENTIAYMDNNAIDQADFFGHSMGGYVALLLASQQPERVGKVFTFGLYFDWTPENAQLQLRSMNPDKIVEKVPKFAQALEARHSGIGWRKNMEMSAEMMVDLGANHTLTPDLLKTIEHPVVISLGDRDGMTTTAQSETAARVLPNGALQVFPNTYHPLEKLNVEMMAEAVTRFLRK